MPEWYAFNRVLDMFRKPCCQLITMGLWFLIIQTKAKGISSQKGEIIASTEEHDSLDGVGARLICFHKGSSRTSQQDRRERCSVDQMPSALGIEKYGQQTDFFRFILMNLWIQKNLGLDIVMKAIYFAAYLQALQCLVLIIPLR